MPVKTNDYFRTSDLRKLSKYTWYRRYDARNDGLSKALYLDITGEVSKRTIVIFGECTEANGLKRNLNESDDHHMQRSIIYHDFHFVVHDHVTTAFLQHFPRSESWTRISRQLQT